MATQKQDVSPRDYGRRLADQTPPITVEQAHAAARIFASIPEDDHGSNAA